MVRQQIKRNNDFEAHLIAYTIHFTYDRKHNANMKTNTLFN